MLELFFIIVALVALAGVVLVLSIVFGAIQWVFKVALFPIALVGKVLGAILVPIFVLVGVVLVICFLPAVIALAAAACVLAVGALLFTAVF